ncbi:DedA family protein [Brevibacterium sp. XM4083]|nr:DedA family protein [Brevibacterium sp. XM4083]
MDFALDLIQQTLTSPWLYLLIAVVAALDSLVPIVPSETVVITAAAYAVTGSPAAAGIIAAATVGALLGDLAAHLVGRGGSRATDRWVRSARLRRLLASTAEMFAVRGGAMLVAGRFIPGGRTATTIASGMLRYPLPRFLAADVLGALAWAAYSTGIGLLGGAVFADQPLWGVVLGVGIALTLTTLAEAVRRLRVKRRTADTESATGLTVGPRSTVPVTADPESAVPAPAVGAAVAVRRCAPGPQRSRLTRSGRTRLLAAARE